MHRRLVLWRMEAETAATYAVVWLFRKTAGRLADAGTMAALDAAVLEHRRAMARLREAGLGTRSPRAPAAGRLPGLGLRQGTRHPGALRSRHQRRAESPHRGGRGRPAVAARAAAPRTSPLPEHRKH